jgi:hypothetical protein
LRSRAALVLAALAWPTVLGAQQGHDLQACAIGLVGGRVFVGAGVGAGLRFPGGLRAAFLAGGGWLEPDRAAGRGELVATFHLTPFRRTGVSVYGGAGVAAVAADAWRGYLMLVVGIEARPAGGGGWFAETGVGGGLRVAAGYRAIVLHRRRR